MAYYRGAVDKNTATLGAPSAWGGETIQLLQKVFWAAHLRRHGVCQPHAALPAVPDQALHRALRGLSLAEAYAADVAHARRCCRGRDAGAAAGPGTRMMAHSDKLEFEQAAEVRNQIQALSRVLHQQAIETVDDKDVDILAVRVQGGRLRESGHGARWAPPG